MGVVSLLAALFFAPSAAKFDREAAIAKLGDPTDDLDTIRFYLWTRGQQWDDNDQYKGAEAFTAYDVTGSEIFNVSKATKFLIHGFTSDAFGFGEQMVKEYMKQGDYNIIAMDWSTLAGLHWDIYYSAAANVVPAADHAALFLNSWMQHYKLWAQDIHLIGHSLGGQLAGRLARAVYGTWGHKIGRISGLDPAGPLFVDDALDKECLKKEDASFVDVIHTNGAMYRPYVVRGYFGNEHNMGHIDFYPNGGQSQPGCWWVPLGGPCSHGRSAELFAESINHPEAFPAKVCESISDCEYGTVTGSFVIHMGEASMHEASPDVLVNNKLYYLPTNDASPYSMESWSQASAIQQRLRHMKNH